MALCKPLRGDSSRISLDVTPFHDGYIYLTTDDGGLYADVLLGTEKRRIRVGGGVTVSQKTATLTASGWSASAPYTQVLNLNEVAADSNGDISVAQSANASQRRAARRALMSLTAQETGKLTITADGEKPGTDIPVMVTIIG